MAFFGIVPERGGAEMDVVCGVDGFVYIVCAVVLSSKLLQAL